jgi:hypothetical protein
MFEHFVSYRNGGRCPTNIKGISESTNAVFGAYKLMQTVDVPVKEVA